ncbi:unnamed protein product [Owenia fusiformis]|uniref:Uncharacterized protein n=1 Tax=Owenia fusiformis TaxID=6347 RepID=A0A8J1TF83_OWEFU|nr:unnamed protein product [Owenia fusiformis]
MAPIKLHGDFLSQPVRAVGLMLKANSIDFDFVSVPLVPVRTTRTEEYAAVNPFKTVPTLEVEGLMNICESSAALQYLAELEGIPEHWYPRSGKGRALVNTYLAWHGPSMRKNASGYFVTSFVGPAFFNLTFTEDQVKEARVGFEAMLDQLENIWLRETSYLAGNDITIADLQCVTELNQVGTTGYDMVKNRPKLAGWIQRVEAKLQPHFDAMCKEPFGKLEEAFKKFNEAK